jgi:hypothetical protein
MFFAVSLRLPLRLAADQTVMGGHGNPLFAGADPDITIARRDIVYDEVGFA